MTDDRIERLERACRASWHVICSLLATREGATDELLIEIRDALAEALHPENAVVLLEGNHRKRHVKLHRALDGLVADFIAHRRSARPSNTSILKLMEWSHKQTIEPEEFDQRGQR